MSADALKTIETDRIPRGGTRPRLHDYGFFVALALGALLLYVTLRTIVVPILLGASVAVLARPACVGLTAWLRGRYRIAAWLTTMGVTLLGVGPLVFFSWWLFQEISDVVSNAVNLVQTEGAGALLSKAPLPRGLKNQVTPDQMQTVVEMVVARVGLLATTIVQRISVFAVGAFLFLITLYYFLIDGPRWLDRIERLLPIERRHAEAFVHEFEQATQALFYCSMATAVVQGGLATLGYWIFDVPQPLLWGSLTGVMSFMPVLGTAAVWVPISGVFLAQGKIGPGLAIAAWGVGISSVDNVLRPLLVKGRMRLHPLLVFLSVLGGLKAFGAIGIFIGPLSAALFLSAVRIYEREYRKRLPDNQPDAVGHAN